MLFSNWVYVGLTPASWPHLSMLLFWYRRSIKVPKLIGDHETSLQTCQVNSECRWSSWATKLESLRELCLKNECLGMKNLTSSIIIQRLMTASTQHCTYLSVSYRKLANFGSIIHNSCSDVDFIIVEGGKLPSLVHSLFYDVLVAFTNKKMPQTICS